MTQPIDTNRHALPGPDDVLRKELDNGLVVLVRENFTSPAVIVSGKVPGGALQETREQAGLANFQASLLMRGTKNHTFSELYEKIEINGASVGVSCGGHTTSFGSKSLAEDLALMLELQAEVLQLPTFPDEHVERVRGQLITRLQARQFNTRQMAALTFKELAYPSDHPYARSISGYLDTVEVFTRDDVVGQHQRLGPRGGIVVVVGAVKAEEAIRLVEENLGGWTNPDQPDLPDAPDAPRIEDVREKFVAIPGKTQADIIFGYPGPRRSAPDYQAARMANSILGVFGLYGRLGDNIREDEGLAYYSYSNLTGGLGPGPWQVSAGVKPEKVEQVVGIIRHEIRRMIEEPVTDEELADNKSFFKGQLVLGLETNEGVAASLMNIEQHQLGLDYLHHYAETVDAITVEDVQRASQQYLNPDSYALAVAGPE